MVPASRQHNSRTINRQTTAKLHGYELLVNRSAYIRRRTLSSLSRAATVGDVCVFVHHERCAHVSPTMTNMLTKSKLIISLKSFAYAHWDRQHPRVSWQAQRFDSSLQRLQRPRAALPSTMVALAGNLRYQAGRSLISLSISSGPARSPAISTSPWD